MLLNIDSVASRVGNEIKFNVDGNSETGEVRREETNRNY